MSTPTPEQIKKLPQWAQSYITGLQRQRDNASETLTRFHDGQTEQPIRVPEHVCDQDKGGPRFLERYVEGRHIEIKWMGVLLRIILRKEGNLSDSCIDLSWENEDGTRPEERGVAMVPHAFNSARLLAKKFLRY